jgi:DNA transformation protein
LAVSREFQDYVIDQLSTVGSILSKRMFGGVGLYADGIFFALIANDILYQKVDDTNRQDYESAGMDAFRPILIIREVCSILRYRLKYLKISRNCMNGQGNL